MAEPETIAQHAVPAHERQTNPDQSLLLVLLRRYNSSELYGEKQGSVMHTTNQNAILVSGLGRRAERYLSSGIR